MTLPTVDMATVQRVLIIKMSAMGDIIHALPVSAALHDAFPHLEITWVVEESFSSLVSGNPCLTNVLTWPKVRGKGLRSLAYHADYFRRLGSMRAHRFDMTLDLQGLSKSGLLAAATGARIRLGYHWLREAAVFFERPVPVRPQSVHVVDQYLDVARFLGAEVEKPRFPFFIPGADQEAVDAMLKGAGLVQGAPFVTINPASAKAFKQWGSGNFAALIDTLRSRHGVVSALVTADKNVASEVAAQTTQPFVNLAGRTNLKELAAVLKRGSLHISGDTGSGHLASALDRPVIALIGPTDADRICPYGQRENVIRHFNLCGVNCNGRHCEFSRPRCLDAIRVEEVVAKAEKFL